MATSKPALSSKSVSSTPKIVTEYQIEALQQAIRDRISRHAYALYEASGREEGNAEHHWLQAEADIFRPGLELRESGSWLSIGAALPDIDPDEVEIYVEAGRVVVHAQKSQATEEKESKTQSMMEAEVFLTRNLPVEVDPSTASAAFKDQKLTLMVKKRYPEGATTTTDARTAN